MNPSLMPQRSALIPAVRIRGPSVQSSSTNSPTSLLCPPARHQAQARILAARRAVGADEAQGTAVVKGHHVRLELALGRNRGGASQARRPALVGGTCAGGNALVRRRRPEALAAVPPDARHH